MVADVGWVVLSEQSNVKRVQRVIVRMKHAEHVRREWDNEGSQTERSAKCAKCGWCVPSREAFNCGDVGNWGSSGVRLLPGSNAGDLLLTIHGVPPHRITLRDM